jgi:hypothetical protein
MLKNIVLDLEQRTIFNHHENLPSSFRALFIGSSGCGKTTLLLQALLTPGFIDYNNLIIYTPTKTQQEYQLLYHGFSNGLSKESLSSILMNQHQFKGIPISQLCKKYAELHKLTGGEGQRQQQITVTLTDRTDDLVPPDKLDKTKKNLIIFDDCVTSSNQNVLRSFFIKGRHNAANCIYLSQSYFDLDKMIRLNTNLLVLFKLSARNKVDLFNNVVGTMMDKREFYALADNVWSKKYQYIVVNRDSEKIITDLFEEESESDSD